MIARRFSHAFSNCICVRRWRRPTWMKHRYNQLSFIDPNAICVLIKINLLTNKHFTLTTNLCAETLTTLVMSHVTRSTSCGVLLLLLVAIQQIVHPLCWGAHGFACTVEEVPDMLWKVLKYCNSWLLQPEEVITELIPSVLQICLGIILEQTIWRSTKNWTNRFWLVVKVTTN